MSEAPTRQRPPFPIRLFIAFLAVTGFGSVLGTVAGFFGQWYWVLDLASHYRVHYALTLTAAGVMAMLFRAKRTAVLCVVFCIVNMITIVPMVLPRPTTPVAGRPSCRLVVSNVLAGNPTPDVAIDYLAGSDADVLVVLEVTDEWVQRLRDALTGYDHVISAPRPDNFGIAVFSRLPLEDGFIWVVGDAEKPSIIATVQLESDASLDLIATHPVPPIGDVRTAWRDQQIEATSAQVAERSKTRPVAVAGDLNATPWSSAFRSIDQETTLRRVAGGFRGTWPATLPSLIRIPIDHVLVTEGIDVTRYETGPNIGSDHRPLVVELEVGG